MSGSTYYRICCLLLALTIMGCAPTIIGPENSNSSLIIGRVVVTNQFQDELGVLPLGVIEKGIQVSIESRDGKQITATTEAGGYFLIPNLSPNTYRINHITLEGARHSVRGDLKSRRRQDLRRLNFTPIPGKVTYVGTLTVAIAENGSATANETRDDRAAQSYFRESYRESPWTLREFVTGGSKSTATTSVAQSKLSIPNDLVQGTAIGPKADRPEWKVGYQWRHAWKGPTESGTETREVIRQETFENVPSYVVRSGKRVNYYVKENLGLLATSLAGKITLKRDAPYRPIVWPLEVVKEWKSSFILENMNLKSSRSYEIRFVVSKIESVNVPAGTFETFKIEGYETFTGNLIDEFWYAPKVKWSVKERSYVNNGVVERELISFNID